MIQTFIDQVFHTAAQRPDAIAIASRGPGGAYTQFTFRELIAHVERFATAVAGATNPGEVVPVAGLRGPQVVAAILGVMRAGCVAAYLNPKLRLAQIRHAVRLSDARILLMHDSILPGLARSAQDDSIPAVCWILSSDPTRASHVQAAFDRLAAHSQFVDFQDVELKADTSARNPKGDDAGFCLFTSGSTGEPKGVLISQSDLLARAAAEIGWFGLSPDDVLLNILPFSFDVGLNQLCTALAIGCQLIISESWTPIDIRSAVVERGVTGISGVPTIWRDMLSVGLNFEGTPVRYITVSGGDLSASDLSRLPTLKNGLGVFKTYGQSEAFRAASLKPHEFGHRMRSVGRPFTGVHLYIVREDGSRASTNETGEIVHAGLGVMLGYLGGRGTGEKLRANPFFGESDPNELAIFTGDLGHVDDEGFLFVEGRRDGMLKVAGNRVYPAEVVDVLLQREGVTDAQVVGVPTPDGETTLIAFIVVGGEFVELAEIRRLAAVLPSYMVPKRIIQDGVLPRTASGKHDLVALKARAKGIIEPDIVDKEQS